MTDAASAFLTERETIKRYQQINPSLITPRLQSTDESLRRIGIEVDFGFRPQGYIHLYHQDFIVEERDIDGKLCTIEPGLIDIPARPDDKHKSLYAELVKIGLSTLEAQAIVGEQLEMPLDAIRFAGIKDKLAITSQRIMIRQPGRQLAEMQSVGGPVFLKNFSWGKGTINKGDLQGNKFTIVVRTPATLGAGWLQQALERLKTQCYNFYYLQRFGTPRIISHELGKLLLLQKFEEATRYFLFDSGLYDVPRINELRQQASQQFGNWLAVDRLYQEFPGTLRPERDLLEQLIRFDGEYLSAIKGLGEQAKMWVYAYNSYLFNRELSRCIVSGEAIPDAIPLLLHPDGFSVASYREQLAADGITQEGLQASLQLLFGRPPQAPLCSTRIELKDVRAEIVDKAIVITFELPAAMYATTVLSHIFDLQPNSPRPAWLDATLHDSKKIMGSGSVATLDEIFKEYYLHTDDVVSAD